MNTAIKNNRKTRFPKGKKILVSAVTGALGILMAPYTCATANSFADTPLRLQQKSITQSAYSVKPNVAIFVDDSLSMGYTLTHNKPSKDPKKLLYKCRKLRPGEKENKLPKYWDSHSGWIQDLTLEEAEAIKSKGGYGCNPYTRFDPAKDILITIINEYRDKMYFALRPLHSEKDGSDQQKWSNSFHETSDSSEFKSMLDNIEKLEGRGLTPTTRVFPVVARNLIMNKLKYRCQRSYIIFLSDGLAGKYRAASDKSFTTPNKDLDEFFDKRFSSNKERDDLLYKGGTGIRSKIVDRLAFYTETLANPMAHTDSKDPKIPGNPLGFGPYIYSKDYYNIKGDNITKGISNFKRTTDEAGKPWNSIDKNTQKPFYQIAETYTIGFALAQVDPDNPEDESKDERAFIYLSNGATPRGLHPRGNFFNANSKTEITEAFRTIFQNISSKEKASTINLTTNAPSMGISSTSTDDLGITAKIETGSWSSQICIHDLTNRNSDKNSDKNSDQNSEDTGQTINKNDCKVQPSFTNRKLLINNGKTTYLYSNLEPEQGLNNNSFKISANADKNKTEWLDGLLTWLSRAKEDKNINQDGFVLGYRQRPDSARNMGDIIDNTILTAGRSEYNKQKYLITSANDGMVYVFRAANDEKHPYDLKFNYMPMSIERDSIDGSDIVGHYYKDMLDEKYGQNSEHPHRYLLNGGIVVRETSDRKDKAGVNQIFMVSTMGQAGRGAFAINIGGQDIVTGNDIAADNIGSEGWYNNVSLFQTPSGANNKLGYTIGKPAIARIRVNRDTEASDTTITDHLRQTAIISNGYNSKDSNDESALYIYDALGVDVGIDSYQQTGDQKGTLIKKIIASKDGGGLSSPTAVDINSDGITDLAYAGDYKGNLYRFDFRSPDPDKWTVKKIFSANAPITVAPAVYRAAENAKNKLVIVFGTGSDIYQSDRDSLQQQTMYGIYDDYTEQKNVLIDKASLVQQTMEDGDGDGDDYRYLTNNTFSPEKNNGWYFNLYKDGERVTESVQKLLTTGIVMTRSYSIERNGELNDPCEESSMTEKTKVVSRLTQFNALTGAALTQNEAHIVVNSDQPLASSSKMANSIGVLVSNTNSGYVDALDAGNSGKELDPQHPIPPSKCFRKKPFGMNDKGEKFEIEGAVMCPISFNRLSWREIKTSYLS